VLGEFAKLEAEVLAAYDQYEFHVVYQKLSQFIARGTLVRLFTTSSKTGSTPPPRIRPRRRSTQTALHRLVTGLCQMLAPILAFTADEAWEFVPGKPTESVHESKLGKNGFFYFAGRIRFMAKIIQIASLRSCQFGECSRKKEIGKSLEAKAEIVGRTDEDHAAARQFRSISGVSKCFSNKIEGKFPIVDADEKLKKMPSGSSSGLAQLNIVLTGSITISRAAGQKCERCWHWETDIGQNAEHPTNLRSLRGSCEKFTVILIAPICLTLPCFRHPLLFETIELPDRDLSRSPDLSGSVRRDCVVRKHHRWLLEIKASEQRSSGLRVFFFYPQ